MQTPFAPSLAQRATRAASALLAVLIFTALPSFLSGARGTDTITAQSVAFMVLFGSMGLGTAGVLAWYAWRGWALPESRAVRAIRFAAYGGIAWAVLGSMLIVAWYSVIERRDAGLAPIIAWLSSPLGALIGIAASRRPRRA